MVYKALKAEAPMYLEEQFTRVPVIKVGLYVAQL